MGKSIPSKSPNTNDLALGTLAFGVDEFEKLTGRQVYYCGKCNKRINFDANARPPLVCKKCGEESDWGGLDKNKVKVCPTCNKEYDLDDVYCENHTTAVRLQEGLR
jgi:DNA-directed RNA polymerase subunit RPC12/RpoP